MDLDQTTTVFNKPKATLYSTLYDLLEAWQESYCYSGDDGGHVEDSIVSHARCMLAMPDASLEEMLDWLLHNS
jgi:hypothetical protein